MQVLSMFNGKTKSHLGSASLATGDYPSINAR